MAKTLKQKSYQEVVPWFRDHGFDVMETPRIALRRVPLSIHILAPSMRPVQVTQDLANFWREHYPRIKSELQRKYPKHEWK